MQTYFDELMAEGVPDKIPADGFAFEDLYDEHIANNQKSWKQDRRLTVGASECFSCIRKTWFTKRGHEFGIEKDPDYVESWGAMERGNIIENHYIVPAIEEGLRRRGMDLIMAGDGQDTIIDDIHSATLDGLIINAPRDLLSYYGVDDIKSDCVVLEMKSFDPRLTLDHEKPVHRGQTQMQMGLIRETTDYKPEFAVLMYINASWLDDIRIFIIPYDDEQYRIGRARNEKVFSAENAGELHAEGKLDGMCQYCAYARTCAESSVRRVPTARKALNKTEVAGQDTQLLGSLDPLVTERMKWKEQKDEADRELETINERIRQALITHGESRAVGDGWKVSYTAQKGRKTLDKSKMIEAGLDPEDYMSEGAGFEKLTVTAAK